MGRVFRCCSGSEAVEFALRAARAASGKPIIVSIDGVYHGHTYGAAAVGNDCVKAMEPCPTGYIKLKMPKTAEEARGVVAQFELLLKERNDIGTFFSEPVWTNAGMFIPPAGFYEAIQELCRKNGVLLVMDEVATGMGRLGKMYASSLWGLEPDIICLGKSFTGGFAAMGATLVTEHVFKNSRAISDYSTFGWLPQDLAATTRNVELLIERDLPKNAEEVGDYLLELLKPLEKLLKVKAVRGLGMAFSIELHLPIANMLAGLCFKNGLTMATADSSTLFFSPPLCMDRETAKRGAEILAKVLGGHLKE
jgi:putrescine aminotransferase